MLSPSEKSGCIYSDIDDRKLLGCEVVRRGWWKSEVIFCSSFAFLQDTLNSDGSLKLGGLLTYLHVFAGQRLLA